MRLPTVTGLIDRRILANYRVDPDCMASALPQPFRPWVYRGYAVGGICLIRLKHIRPKAFPFPWGIGSENAAHRIAVEWDSDGEVRRGVYIRDAIRIRGSMCWPVAGSFLVSIITRRSRSRRGAIDFQLK